MEEKRSDWAALMTRAQDGDGRAYASLLSEVASWLRALARQSGVEPDDIDDAVQDILLTLHEVRHTYDPHRPFAPWLSGIARHRLIDRLRQRTRRRSREVPLGEKHETFAATGTNGVEARLEMPQLMASVASLPGGQRQAVELLRMKEMSLKEAAAASGQSETALKVALHRALKRLRILVNGW